MNYLSYSKTQQNLYIQQQKIILKKHFMSEMLMILCDFMTEI